MNLPMKPDLTGRIAVVTGGAGVLCAPFCRALAACGARVGVLGRTKEKVEALAEEIREGGGQALDLCADVTDLPSLRRANEILKSAWGPCDLLVNGAGGNRPDATADDEFFSPLTLDDPGRKSFFDLPETAFREVFSLNLLGTVLPTQVFAEDMARAGKGTILNISSMNAFTPLTKIPAYSAAKAAVSNFTEWLAVHFAGSGIRVNAIAPGFFSTAQNAKLLWNEDGSPTPRTGKILAATPMGRFGRPEELIGALLFLCDEACSGFITGVVLPVDGGFRAYSGV